MANNNNIVQIGSALKWRGIYEDNKKYYQENIVTMNGCVFRCRVLQTQNTPPLEADVTENELKYINTDVWDVIVDLSDYYNRFLVQQLVNKDFEEQLKKLQARAKSLEDVVEGFGTIMEAPDLNSVVNNGVWKNYLPWDNDALWANPKRYGQLDVNGPMEQVIRSLVQEYLANWEGPDNLLTTDKADERFAEVEEKINKKADDDKVLKAVAFTTDTGGTGANPNQFIIRLLGNHNTFHEGTQGEPTINVSNVQNNIYFDVNTDVIATKESVDNLKQDFDSLLNDENLNDSFDTLKEVDTWIKSHEEEASDIIKRQQAIEKWKSYFDNSILTTVPRINMATATKDLEILFDRVDLENGNKYTNVLKLPAATATTSGVMSPDNVKALDLLQSSKADRTELSPLLYEEVADGDSVEDFDTVPLKELRYGVFVDLWNSAAGSNGRYNEDTGYFELNGITDITYEEALEIYSYKTLTVLASNQGDSTSASLRNSTVRTFFPFTAISTTNNAYMFAMCSNLEVVKGKGNIWFNANMYATFENCSNLRRMEITIQSLNASIIDSTTFRGCHKLEFLRINTKTNVNVGACKSLSLESFQYMITNASNTSPITITVHAEVYAKLLGEGDYSNGDGTADDWTALMATAAAKNISFATV